MQIDSLPARGAAGAGDSAFLGNGCKRISAVLRSVTLSAITGNTKLKLHLSFSEEEVSILKRALLSLFNEV